MLVVRTIESTNSGSSGIVPWWSRFTFTRGTTAVSVAPPVTDLFLHKRRTCEYSEGCDGAFIREARGAIHAAVVPAGSSAPANEER